MGEWIVEICDLPRPTLRANATLSLWVCISATFSSAAIRRRMKGLPSRSSAAALKASLTWPKLCLLRPEIGSESRRSEHSQHRKQRSPRLQSLAPGRACTAHGPSCGTTFLGGEVTCWRLWFRERRRRDPYESYKGLAGKDEASF